VMEIEVYGCPLPDPPVCGDGITTPPEKCDLGPGENTFFSTQCDHMCMKIKPPVCHYTGECPTPDPEPVAETVGLGAGYVAESQLPAWVIVEDVDFGRYFNGCEDYSSAATEECSNIDDSERQCPGDLTKTWHLTAKEFMCSHQVTSDAIVKNKHYEPYSMLVSGPSGGHIKYASIRGHVRGSGRGGEDAALRMRAGCVQRPAQSAASLSQLCFARVPHPSFTHSTGCIYERARS